MTKSCLNCGKLNKAKLPMCSDYGCRRHAGAASYIGTDHWEPIVKGCPVGEGCEHFGKNFTCFSCSRWPMKDKFIPVKYECTADERKSLDAIPILIRFITETLTYTGDSFPEIFNEARKTLDAWDKARS